MQHRVLLMLLSYDIISMIQNFIEWLQDTFQNRTLGARRSSEWREVRNKHIESHPECAVCGKEGKLLKANQVHHCIPFSVDQSKELEPSNLITLCPEHHLTFGHLQWFGSHNPDIIKDAKIWRDKINNRP